VNSKQVERPGGWTLIDVALFLVGVAGLTSSLTMLFLSMRAVLDVGGFCAEGGPYQIETHCPDGALLAPLAIFTGLGSAGLMAWRGSRLGARYAGLVFLAWPALFMSLGWNFIEYGIWPPPPATGIEWGWLIPGVLFEIMGAFPLLSVLPLAGATGVAGSRFSPARSSAASRESDAVLADGEARYAAALRRTRGRLLADLVQRAEQQPPPTSQSVGGASVPADDDLVSKLERLSALHRSGSLTYDEFQRAKAALLDGQNP
jgi:hypothetical protein